MTMSQSKADKQWQAEQDARTLMSSAQIQADKARHTAAKQHIQTQIKQMTTVVRPTPSPKPTTKPTTKPKTPK